jgi:hypothetical protein
MSRKSGKVNGYTLGIFAAVVAFIASGGQEPARSSAACRRGPVGSAPDAAVGGVSPARVSGQSAAEARR